jgi:hypothetical protein
MRLVVASTALAPSSHVVVHVPRGESALGTALDGLVVTKDHGSEMAMRRLFGANASSKRSTTGSSAAITALKARLERICNKACCVIGWRYLERSLVG